jgi:hypothetical protein
MQEDWQAYLERHCYDSSNEEESECSDTEVSELRSVTDSTSSDDCLHDFDDVDFADMPDLETVYDTDDEIDGPAERLHDVSEDIPYFRTGHHHRDDDNAAGGSSFPIEESLDSSEGESSVVLRQQPEKSNLTFMR